MYHLINIIYSLFSILPYLHAMIEMVGVEHVLEVRLRFVDDKLEERKNNA